MIVSLAPVAAAQDLNPPRSDDVVVTAMRKFEDRRLSPRVRRQMRTAIGRGMDGCLRTSRRAMVLDLTWRREAAAAAEPGR